MDVQINTDNLKLITTNQIYTIKCTVSGKKIILFLTSQIDEPLLFLVTLEKMLQEKGFQVLELVIPKSNNKLLDFLIHSTYSIISGNFENITFSKYISQEKRIRLSLTEHCNYRCFFCHEEGMDMNTSRGKTSEEEMYKLLLKLKNKGYNAITFTGGEPLLEKKSLLNYLDFMLKNDYIPSVTIVTNGYLIDDDFLSQIKKYPGKIKFNVSLHSIDSSSYISIVNPKNNDTEAFDRVCMNLYKLKNLGIKFKLNFVLLKDINTDIEYLEKILKFAFEHGAFGVKFLELLITEKNNSHFDRLFTLSSLKKTLESSIILKNSTYRRDEYEYLPYKLSVEFQKCTCANGCSNCPLDRAVNITPQMDYYPCFSISSNKIHVSSENFDESLKKGEKIIEGFIKKYKNKSPVLIKNAKTVLEKTEYNYSTSLPVSEIENELKNQGFRLDRKRVFEEHYYIQSDTTDYSFTKIIKLALNSYDSFYKEIVSERTFNPLSSSIYTHYLTKGRIINNKEEYDNLMAHLGYSDRIVFKWSNLVYLKNEETITISENLNTGLLFVLSPSPLIEIKKYNLQLISNKSDFCQIIYNRMK